MEAREDAAFILYSVPHYCVADVRACSAIDYYKPSAFLLSLQRLHALVTSNSRGLTLARHQILVVTLHDSIKPVINVKIRKPDMYTEVIFD